MNRDTFEVQSEQEGERLDKYLSSIYPDISRSFFQRILKENQILVNDKPQKANYRLKTDDIVDVTIPDAVQTPILPQDIPLDILYEDDDVLVVNKPKGMVVHPSAGHYSDTLVNAIMYHCKDSLSGINGEIRPGIVHRIDMDTTGSLIVCKNDESHIKISEQIKDHSCNRIYVGIVCGNVKNDEGTIEGAIGRNPNDRKKWPSMRKTESRLSHIIRCLNALVTIHICSLSLRPAEHIRYACIWQVLIIPCLEICCIRAIPRRKTASKALKDSACMQKQ